MSGLESLLIYLAIAAVIVGIGRPKGMGRYRRGLNKLANSKVENLAAAKVIASVGDSKRVDTFVGRRVHRLTVGTKLLSTFLASALVVLIYKDVDAAQPLIAPAGHGETVFLSSLGIVGYYLAYIWSYKVVIQDFELRVPTYFFSSRPYDLRQLEWFEDDGAYTLSLWFEDGGKASIMKYVEGRATLLKELSSYAKANEARGGVSA